MRDSAVYSAGAGSRETRQMSRLPGKRGGKHGLWYGFKRAVTLSAWPALNREYVGALNSRGGTGGWYKCFLIKPMPWQRLACSEARAHLFTIDERYAYLQSLRSRPDYLMHNFSVLTQQYGMHRTRSQRDQARHTKKGYRIKVNKRIKATNTAPESPQRTAA